MTRVSAQQDSSLALMQRWLMIIGGAFVLLGGAVAAVASPLDIAKGSWLSAYLVLVAGVPVYLVGQFIAHWIVGRGGWALLVGWYLGNAAVVVGSLLSFPLLVDLGGIVLLVPLVIMLWIALQQGRIAGSTRSRGAEIGRLLLMAALVVMIFSIPVGLVLAHIRA